jgi:hypothetical protein
LVLINFNNYAWKQPQMKRFELNKDTVLNKKPLVLIFTEGTIIGPKRLIDFFNIKKYVPIKNCIDKMDGWEKHKPLLDNIP